MAEIDHPNGDVRAQMAEVFKGANYCFATKETGRSPSFYFARGGLTALNTASLCGRIRTDHPSGPLIDITTYPKSHIFTDRRRTQSGIHEEIRHLRTADDIAQLGARHRTVPREGDYHNEVTMTPPPKSRREFSRNHASGGVICMQPRITSDDQAIKLLNRVLGYAYVVKINNKAQPSAPILPPQMGTVRPGQGIGLGLVDYLASL